MINNTHLTNSLKDGQLFLYDTYFSIGTRKRKKHSRIYVPMREQHFSILLSILVSILLSITVSPLELCFM